MTELTPPSVLPGGSKQEASGLQSRLAVFNVLISFEHAANAWDVELLGHVELDQVDPGRVPSNAIPAKPSRATYRPKAPSRKGVLKANQLLDAALGGSPISNPPSQAISLSESERAWINHLSYGILRRWYLLERWVSPRCHTPWRMLEPSVRLLLRMGTYQLLYMDAVPAFAAIHTSVALAKQLHLSAKAVKLINAVLRRVQANLPNTALPPLERLATASNEALAVEFGWPVWLLKRLAKQYDRSTLLSILQYSQQPAGNGLRVNTLKTTVEAYQQRLLAQNISFLQPFPDTLPEFFWLPPGSGGPGRWPGIDSGEVYPQDLGSGWIAHLLDPQPGEILLDLCAAPGSKASHLWQRMQGQGRLYALDCNASRVQLLRETFRRLGIDTPDVQCLLQNALQFQPDPAWIADRILLDAPCSGLGTVRRHPEILLLLTPGHIAAQTLLQQALIEQAASLLRPGGVLVYSTCSLDASENQAIVDRFLEQHPSFVSQPSPKLWPEPLGPYTDGFYHAVLSKTALHNE
ncbi:MAG: transcription antitermination factor NusB [Candidatus Melainabacteria bacterium]|nr:transcription antitermination factor NusB [Candidatus Melainabacteria bacterium]